MAITTTRPIVRSLTTGAAGLSKELTHATRDIEIQSIELHLAAAGATAENFTITRDVDAGSAYNTLLFSQNMNTETDAVLTDDDAKFVILAGDSLVFAYTNTDTRTFGLTIMYHFLPNKGTPGA